MRATIFKHSGRFTVIVEAEKPLFYDTTIRDPQRVLNVLSTFFGVGWRGKTSFQGIQKLPQPSNPYTKLLTRLESAKEASIGNSQSRGSKMTSSVNVGAFNTLRTFLLENQKKYEALKVKSSIDFLTDPSEQIREAYVKWNSYGVLYSSLQIRLVCLGSISIPFDVQVVLQTFKDEVLERRKSYQEFLERAAALYINELKDTDRVEGLQSLEMRKIYDEILEVIASCQGFAK